MKNKKSNYFYYQQKVIENINNLKLRKKNEY